MSRLTSVNSCLRVIHRFVAKPSIWRSSIRCATDGVKPPANPDAIKSTAKSDADEKRMPYNYLSDDTMWEKSPEMDLLDKVTNPKMLGKSAEEGKPNPIILNSEKVVSAMGISSDGSDRVIKGRTEKSTERDEINLLGTNLDVVEPPVRKNFLNFDETLVNDYIISMSSDDAGDYDPNDLDIGGQQLLERIQRYFRDRDAIEASYDGDESESEESHEFMSSHFADELNSALTPNIAMGNEEENELIQYMEDTEADNVFSCVENTEAEDASADVMQQSLVCMEKPEDDFKSAPNESDDKTLLYEDYNESKQHPVVPYKAFPVVNVPINSMQPSQRPMSTTKSPDRVSMQQKQLSAPDSRKLLRCALLQALRKLDDGDINITAKITMAKPEKTKETE